ncbi:MAG TPA: hypothetical protein PKA95_13470, partial [Thermomicrobiales bacterium]|nr:hypothetical protein [Thermomicrobiales bacterium]
DVGPGDVRVPRPGDLGRLWRPTLAGAGGALTGLLIAAEAGALAGATSAGIVFVLVSLATRVVGSEERGIIARALGRAQA